MGGCERIRLSPRVVIRLPVTLGFLMTREIAHPKSPEKGLYSIAANFQPGKLPGNGILSPTGTSRLG
jgi:Mn-containing catalase